METLTEQSGMDQDCSAGLSLVLGIGNGTATREKDETYVSQKKVNGPPLQLDLFPLNWDSGQGTFPWEKTSPSIGTSGVGSDRSKGESMAPIHQVALSWRSDANKCPASCLSNEDAGGINVSLSNSTVDSNATNLGIGYAEIKRRRDDGDQLENDRFWSRVLSDVEEEGCSRKKLRLSREQCVVLEESFGNNRVPEPKEKQALALKLNLRPRQVEVWFKNRRARTKLKKIEVDCEVLKRYNEALAHENTKLRIELENLKALKLSSPPLRTASGLTMCPSCERVSAADNSSRFTLARYGSML